MTNHCKRLHCSGNTVAGEILGIERISPAGDPKQERRNKRKQKKR
jgi:hypothetical protein